MGGGEDGGRAERVVHEGGRRGHGAHALDARGQQLHRVLAGRVNQAPVRAAQIRVIVCCVVARRRREVSGGKRTQTTAFNRHAENFDRIFKEWLFNCFFPTRNIFKE